MKYLKKYALLLLIMLCYQQGRAQYDIKIEISDSKVLEYKGKAKADKDRVSIEFRITADSLPLDNVGDDLK